MPPTKNFLQRHPELNLVRSAAKRKFSCIALLALKITYTVGSVLSLNLVQLLSGLLVDDIKDIESEALRNDLSLSLRKTKDSWICLQSEKMTKISH